MIGSMRTGSLRRRAHRAAATATVAAALAAVGAPAALAHVGIEPSTLPPGQPNRITLYAPNEGKTPATSLEAVFPEGMVPAVAEAVPGWTARVDGQTVTWSGGSIPVGTYGLFSAMVEAPDETGSALVRTTLGYADGYRQVFQPVVLVREAEPPKAADQASRTGVKWAMGLAVAGLALAAAVGFLALWLWLRAGDAPGERS